MADLFTPEELEELRRFDAEIDAEDEAPTYEEIVKSREKDRTIRAERRGWKPSAASTEKSRAQSRAYYWAHKEEHAAYMQAYRAAHRAELLAYQKAYRAAHRAEQNAYNKAWRRANPEKARAMDKRAYEKRKEKQQHEKHDGD